jgi:uncharacterized membrane protein YbhN (UPF0104 family)
LPGGLGVAVASVAGMLLILLEDDGIGRGVATAATLIIRFATLWFAVFLGFAALAIISRKLAASARATQADGNPTQPSPARLGGPTA